MSILSIRSFCNLYVLFVIQIKCQSFFCDRDKVPIILTSIHWSQVKMIGSPARESNSSKSNSSCDEEHGKRCVTVDVAS